MLEQREWNPDSGRQHLPDQQGARTGGHLLGSVQMEIQHSAQIRGGSSGGPLVNRQGHVVGVNYAAPTAGTAGINYAIATAEVEAIVIELSTGKDITSIGLNGEALEDGSGIWVLSVKPGFALDKAGVQASDTITSFGGVDAAGDGSMSKYCSVLRSAQPGATIDIEVLRGDGQTSSGRSTVASCPWPMAPRNPGSHRSSLQPVRCRPMPRSSSRTFPQTTAIGARQTSCSRT